MYQHQVRLCIFRGHEIHLASFVEAFRLLKLFNSRESNSAPPSRHLASACTVQAGNMSPRLEYLQRD